MTNNGFSLDANGGDRSSLIAAQLRLVHDVISRLEANRVDTTEYACLKALVLFKPGKLALLHRNNQSAVNNFVYIFNRCFCKF